MVVTTTLGNILTYSIYQSPTAKEVGIFTYSDDSPLYIYEGQPIRTAFPGPGEANGVREMFLQFKMIVRMDSEMSTAIALDEDLMISTKSPPAIQLVKWNNKNSTDESNPPSNNATITSSSGHQTRTVILSHLDWISKYIKSLEHKADKPTIICSTWNKPMRLFIWIFSDHSVWTVTMREEKRRSSTGPNSKVPQLFEGHCLHKYTKKKYGEDKAIKAEVNARFSLVAVGCSSGRLYLYNIKDYNGNAVLVKVIEPPASSSGRINTVTCSTDGYGWFVGYEEGWAFYSVFGMLNASSFISSADQRQREKWMGGIHQAVWSFSGDAIYILPKNRDSIWLLDTLRWNATGNFIQANISHPVLFKDSKLMLYRGQDQSSLTTVDKDALLWINVPIPASYIAENWPIKYVSSSTDGKFVAVAGVRGVTHYSLNSGRWKLFVEEDIDKEFAVRGGMVWYGNMLILAIDNGMGFEIQIYSRELDLDSENLLYSEKLPAVAITIFTLGNSLMVYTANNFLYQYNIIIQENQISLELVSEISFVGIIHSPSRIRSISCIPKVDPSQSPFSITSSNILLLIDGMLIQLIPRAFLETHISEDHHTATSEMKYKFRVLHNYVEYYAFSGVQGDPRHMIWAFDGKNVLTWVNDKQGTFGSHNDKDNMFETGSESATPISVPMELYPLAMLSDKGIVMGIDCDAVLTRSGSFTYFKQWTSAHLFLPYILESHLKCNDTDRALKIANLYKHLTYFEHMLEFLLYDVLVNISRSEELDTSTLLTNTVNLISQFPQMPDVIVGCTRKTEVKYWKRLFDVVGSPQQLFERCLDLNKLSTASGYLLVLHTLDQNKNFENDANVHSETLMNTARLLKIAFEAQNWALCKELIRFVKSIEPSGGLLKETLKATEVILPEISNMSISNETGIKA